MSKNNKALLDEVIGPLPYVGNNPKYKKLGKCRYKILGIDADTLKPIAVQTMTNLRNDDTWKIIRQQILKGRQVAVYGAPYCANHPDRIDADAFKDHNAEYFVYDSMGKEIDIQAELEQPESMFDALFTQPSSHNNK